MPHSFTPGPWFIEDNDRAISSNAVIGIALVNMANIRYGWDGPDFVTASHRAANARLIAAAPELLAVLQELAESAEYWSEYDVPVGIVDRINDAIAKAVGDTPPKCRCNFRQKTVGDGCAICNPELAADYATDGIAKAGGES